MHFKIDENLPADSAALLRQAGHKADTLHDQNLQGRSDAKLADVCRREARSLITLDLDFADIRVYPPEEYSGLVVLRPRLQAKAHVLNLLRSIIPLLISEPLAGRLWIVDERGVRIRPGAPADDLQ